MGCKFFRNLFSQVYAAHFASPLALILCDDNEDCRQQINILNMKETEKCDSGCP